jgi:hypothetical protein
METEMFFRHTRKQERTRRHGLLLEDHDVAMPEFMTPWTYVSRGPYRLQIRDDNDPAGVLCDVRDAPYLEYAVAMFHDLALPMRWHHICVLLDESFRVVLGYSSQPWAREMSAGMVWWGTAESFQILERWGEQDAMEMAVWESLARENT